MYGYVLVFVNIVCGMIAVLFGILCDTVFCRRYDDMRPMFSMYWFKRMEGVGVTRSLRNRRDGYIEEDFN